MKLFAMSVPPTIKSDTLRTAFIALDGKEIKEADLQLIVRKVKRARKLGIELKTSFDPIEMSSLEIYFNEIERVKNILIQMRLSKKKIFKRKGETKIPKKLIKEEIAKRMLLIGGHSIKEICKISKVKAARLATIKKRLHFKENLYSEGRGRKAILKPWVIKA